MVHMVDVEVAEAAAARPEEAVEAPNLVFEIAHAGRLGQGLGVACRTVHAVSAHQNNLAKLPVLYSVVQFLKVRRVAGHKADADFQSCRRSLVSELDHSPAAR